jgi:hypothetical protein
MRVGVVVARSEVRADARCAAQIVVVVVVAMVCMMDVSDRRSLPRVCGRVDVCGVVHPFPSSSLAT